MNILSIFDGMSVGLAALKETDLKVDNYFASEIDKYAIKIAKKNHPEIQHLGDVNDFDSWDLPKIDLIIGGSPCQGFSRAGKGLNFEDPRSKLFFKYVDCIKKFDPEYFFLENVLMEDCHQRVITGILGVEPVMINSNLVSAQNRKRLYWCNWKIEQPKDKGILLKDIIECGSNQVYQIGRGKNKGGLINNKSPTMTFNSWEYNVLLASRITGRNPDNPTSRKSGLPTQQMLEINKNSQKTNCLTTAQKDNVIALVKNVSDDGLIFTCGLEKGRRIDDGKNLSRNFREGSMVYSTEGKSATLTAQSKGGEGGYSGLYGDIFNYRKLTVIECERLQTLEDNYTEAVSNSQRYKMIGNGWTKDVIAHIFSFINNPPEEFQMSFEDMLQET